MSSWFSSSLISDASVSLGSSVRSSVSSESQQPSVEFDDSAPKKTIYLIRHAESEENVKMHGLQEVGMSLYDRRLPSSQDLSKSLSFIASGAKGDTDSDLSPQGREQINELFQILDTDSQKNLHSLINDVDVIGHSPLIRAKDTCYGAFGLDKNDQPENVVELMCLEEATPWETVVQGRKNTVHKRIEELKVWIDNQTDATTIALVGHSEYFMIMLGISRAEKFWNCDVWRVQYQSGGRWTGLELKHRLNSSKPMGVM
jgi:phosphohistidine phosphatase SixA